MKRQIRTLFKYVDSRVADLILRTNKVRCAPLEEMNDPFEGQVIDNYDFTDEEMFLALERFLLRLTQGEKIKIVDTPGSLIHGFTGLVHCFQSGAFGTMTAAAFVVMMMKIARGKEVSRDREWERSVYVKLARYIHAFCSSTTFNDPLMWSHDADSHRGCVLEFDASDLSEDFFKESKPVRYEDSLAMTGDEAVKGAFFGIFDPEEWTEKRLYTKGNAWAYEREWRVLVREDKVDGEWLRSFDPCSLLGIYFGLRIRKSRGRPWLPLPPRIIRGLIYTI